LDFKPFLYTKRASRKKIQATKVGEVFDQKNRQESESRRAAKNAQEVNLLLPAKGRACVYPFPEGPKQMLYMEFEKKQKKQKTEGLQDRRDKRGGENFRKKGR